LYLRVGELADLRHNNSVATLDANVIDDSNVEISKSHSAITNLSNIEKGNPYINRKYIRG
jgi:hypothetical protein